MKVMDALRRAKATRAVEYRTAMSQKSGLAEYGNKAANFGRVPRGWVILGAAGASWAVFAGAGMGFVALARAVFG